MNMPLKATISRSAIAPALKDTDLTSFAILEAVEGVHPSTEIPLQTEGRSGLSSVAPDMPRASKKPPAGFWYYSPMIPIPPRKIRFRDDQDDAQQLLKYVIHGNLRSRRRIINSGSTAGSRPNDLGQVLRIPSPQNKNGALALTTVLFFFLLLFNMLLTFVGPYLLYRSRIGFLMHSPLYDRGWVVF